MIRSHARQRTTPWIAGIGPSSTIRARKALCLELSLGGTLAILNHAVIDSGIPRESATQRLGISPANRRAGNVTKVPPPASEFRAPPRNAAIMRTTVVTRCGVCGLQCAGLNAVTVALGLTYCRGV